ncbi:MAG: aspartyl-tRNA(Asn)/glutamyl-tRNA(Gln) amidotransferase subunit A [Rickettsiales bacterium]|jgi:aspartyl-tRNA(Asn)/glutamyl-tRNA(Gln) amidotransferase subunit A
MTDLTKLTLKQAISGLKNKDFKAIELNQAYIDNAVKNRGLGAFITETFDLALDAAKIADQNIAKNEARVLEGIPLAIKDLFCTKGIRTTSASKMLENFVPDYESTVTQKLWNEGATMIGKANMDEFAMGSTNTTSYFGPVINNHKKHGSDENLVPGGSSGGSAVAVSANLAAAATGSDTGGSIRQPASFTGAVGIKPTYGRCSRYGMVAFASSLDQAGIFTKDVADAALLTKIISGYDDKDSTSINQAIPDFDALLKSDVRGKRIGIPKEYRADNLPEEIKNLWDIGAKLLKENGAEIIDISLPHTKYAAAVYYIIAPAEASSNLSRFDGVRYGHRTAEQNLSLEQMYEKTRNEGFGDEVKTRIMTGTYVLSAGYYDAYYKKAGQVRRLILEDFKNAFRQVDAILTPVAPSAAFALDKSKIDSDPIAMYLNDVFTIPASLAGLPAMSIPFGINKDGLPLGLQIIGDHFDEQTILDVALRLEQK